MSSRDVRHLAVVMMVMNVAALNGCSAGGKHEAAAVTGGSAERGSLAMERYGCNACHAIAGFPDPSTAVAAPITGIAHRTYIAGTLPTTPENLVLWIRFPHKVKPATAMPDLGVSESEARDVVAYLYSLR